MAKERNCSRCGVEDTHEHRCFHCVKFTSVHARHREIIDTTLRMQSSLRAHLLPSRNPEWRGFKHFLNTPEMVERRAWVAASLDLFTDGSCWNPDLIDYALGAWAVVCPQADRWGVIRGKLSGPCQHNDKAEVHAIKNALDISFGLPGGDRHLE